MGKRVRVLGVIENPLLRGTRINPFCFSGETTTLPDETADEMVRRGRADYLNEEDRP